MSDEINRHRRRFLSAAAVTIAATQFTPNGAAKAQTGETKAAGTPTIKPGTNTSFGA